MVENTRVKMVTMRVVLVVVANNRWQLASQVAGERDG